MANNFSGDANCVAFWRFESEELTVDSKGTNTLTDNNTVGESTGDYKEGACAANFEYNNSEYFSILDANLDAGFPLKNGDTNKKISICFWCKWESVVDCYIVSKWLTSPGKRSIIVGCTIAAPYGYWRFAIGYNSGDSTELLHDAQVAILTNHWYHVAATFDDATKAWRLVVWDDTLQSKVVDDSGTATNNINVEDAQFQIGHYDGAAGMYMDGLVDECVIFKDILTTDEIDQIRSGTYGSGYTLSAGSGDFALTGLAAQLLRSALMEVLAGGFTLTGQAATLLRSFLISALEGSFTETGQAVSLFRDAQLAAGSGDFALTGQAAGLLRSFLISALAGSYTEDGQAADLLRSMQIVASSGEFLIDGQAANLLRSFLMLALTGSFVLTGQDVTLTKTTGGEYVLSCDAGSFQVSGQGVGLLRDALVSAAAGNYMTTGEAAALLRSLQLSAAAGDFALTGQEASLLRSILMYALTGQFALTGQDVTLTKTSTGYILTCEAGTFEISSEPIDLLKTYLLDAAAGSYLFTGEMANLLKLYIFGINPTIEDVDPVWSMEDVTPVRTIEELY